MLVYNKEVNIKTVFLMSEYIGCKVIVASKWRIKCIIPESVRSYTIDRSRPQPVLDKFPENPKTYRDNGSL